MPVGKEEEGGKRLYYTPAAIDMLIGKYQLCAEAYRLHPDQVNRTRTDRREEGTGIAKLESEERFDLHQHLWG